MTLRGAFLRFAAVGVSNTILSFLTYTVALRTLPAIQSRAFVAQAVSYLVGIAWSFVWQRSWSFRSQGAALPEARRFLVSQLAMLAFSSGLISLFVDRMGWNATLSWVGVMGVVTVLSFITLRAWVFRPPPPSLHDRV
jgi:putative flippase GtrA